MTNLRRERGLAIHQRKAAKFRLVAEDTYLVPAETTNAAGYVVDAAQGTCTCADFEEQGLRCKHQWALAFFRNELEAPEASALVDTIDHQTYKRDWPAYNQAQVHEKAYVTRFLRGLCDGIQEDVQTIGRPRIKLGDVVFAAGLKVYTTVSARRAAEDIQTYGNAKNAANTLFQQGAEHGWMGGMAHPPSYNTILRYAESPTLTPLLKVLVEESAKPLRTIDTQFAQDGTGFSTSTFGRWRDHKYGEESRSRLYVKLHAMIGTKTNVITAAAMTVGTENDSPHLPPLLATTIANGFTVHEVSADKAYLSNDNLVAIESAGAVPYIPFKINSGATGHSGAWQRAYHYCAFRHEDFLKHYHQRSNVEATFSAIKRLFGGSVRARTLSAQFNEVLFKVICYNLTALVHAMFELKIDAATFWSKSEVPRG